ncbi:MAG: hypothetical protein ABR974_00560 [Bacteroidales bacterium]|jgi:hypothetical protein
MKKLILVILAMFSANMLPAQNPTPDSLVAKFLKTIGQDKMANMQTVKVTGKITYKNKRTVAITTIDKSSGLHRTEINMQGTMIIYAGDKKNSWMIDPTTGSSDPQDLPTDEVKQNIADYAYPYADWDNPLIKWKERGDKLELIKIEDLNGTPVYNIKITDKDRNYVNFYMDSTKFIILKAIYNIKEEGRTFEGEELYSDFRSNDGITAAFKVEEFINDQKMATMVIDKMEFNIPIFDILFKKPVIKKQ